MAGQSWTHHNIGRLIIFAAKKLYLESGFLNLGSIALCVEATFLPARLRLIQTKVAAYLGSTATPLEGEGNVSALNAEIDTPFYGQVLTDGQNSKTLTGTLSATVTDLCANTYTNASAIYGNSDTVQRKLCQKYVPSSLYSGKLRLYVQAVYGSTRTDYYPTPLTINPSANTFDVVINGYRLNQGLATSGLFTDSDYNYYLIEAGYSSFTFKRLKFSSAARGWLDILATHPDRLDRPFASRVEAYALSTAVIDPDFTPVTRSTGLSISGTPYAYGFKFNWQGNQAKVVNHRSIGDGTYRGSVITVDIADDLTITASQSAEGAWSNSEYFQFWYPDMFDAVTKTQGVVPASPINSAGCPMYGYYDANDVWQVFSVSCSVGSTAPFTTSTGPITNAELPGYGLDAPTHEWHVRESASTQITGTIGFSFKDQGLSSPVSSNLKTESSTGAFVYYNGGGITWESVFYSINNNGPVTQEVGLLMPYMRGAHPAGHNVVGWKEWSFGVNSHTMGVATGTAPNPTTWVALQSMANGAAGVAYASWVELTGRAEKMEVMMGVPFGDCESLVYGYVSGSSWANRRTATANANISLRSLHARKVTQTGRFASDITSTTYADPYNNKQAIHTGQGSGLSLSGLSGFLGPGASTTTKVVFDSASIGKWVHDESDGYVIRESSDSVLMPSWAEKFFRVGDGFGGVYNPTMIARASANGAHIFYHSEPGSPNENGYPDGANYSAIGWV